MFNIQIYTRPLPRKRQHDDRRRRRLWRLTPGHPSPPPERGAEGRVWGTGRRVVHTSGQAPRCSRQPTSPPAGRKAVHPTTLEGILEAGEPCRTTWLALETLTGQASPQNRGESDSGDGLLCVPFGAPPLFSLSLSGSLTPSLGASLHLREPGEHGLPDGIFVGVGTRQSVRAALGSQASSL